jgi:hypothetical protein
MIKETYRRGVSISEIARVADHDRKTIRDVKRVPIMASPQVQGERCLTFRVNSNENRTGR